MSDDVRTQFERVGVSDRYDDYETITLMSEAISTKGYRVKTEARCEVLESLFVGDDVDDVLRTALMARLRAARDREAEKQGEPADAGGWHEVWWIGNTEDAATAFMQNREPRQLDW